MPKEWILNQANMRWGLTKKSKVGPVSELIRKCSPKSLEEWETYYFKEAFPKDYLAALGKKLYIKISEICRAEIENISEAECIKFIIELVINRTYDGYQAEIQTIYGQLQKELGLKVEPAPDEWDLGLQIKPAGYEYITQIINEREFQKKTNEKFKQKYGGSVFYIISIAEGKNKTIYNKEIIDEIRAEIDRLEKA